MTQAIAGMAKFLLPLDNTPPKIGPIISPTRHSYGHKRRELEPPFVHFTQQKLPQDAISEISDGILIPVNTRADWRRKIKTNPGCGRVA
jgi:hypothetical protein